jgi:hydrogenase nickel incorporation protein HypA/HybF
VGVHELSLIEGVVDAVTEQVGDRRVTLVRLAIGALAGVAVDALRFSFDVCTRGTSLEGAVLDIMPIAGRARCRRCGGEYDAPTLATPCPCGSFDRELVAGDELRLVEVEIEDVPDLRV